MRHLVGVRLDLFQEAKLFELGDDGLPGGEPVLPGERADEVWIRDSLDGAQLALDLAEEDARLGVEHRRHGDAVALAHLEVVEVVRRGDLDRAGALLGVGVFVRHHRDRPPDQR
jgi:hypothetical protein